MMHVWLLPVAAMQLNVSLFLFLFVFLQLSQHPDTMGA
jgi:hypothetical protein